MTENNKSKLTNAPTPSKEQLEFLDRKFGIFFHFGIRTFNEMSRDWDRVPMSPDTFNPTELNCEQWIKSIKEAGATYAVLTTKHHDGFANWPSKYTDYCVKNSPWKNGKGDVVKEFTQACRKYDIKIGLYYSCAQFSTKDMTNEQYNDFVYGQLEELFGGNYGEIDEIWFDGCGSENFDFDTERIEKGLRKMQPNALIFGSWGNDIKWVGNEWGHAQMNNSSIIASQDIIKFAPVECDSCITRNTPENFWFYNEANKGYIRTVDELVGMYMLSVGRGSNMLLNIAPDRRGLLPQYAVDRLVAMNREIDFRLNKCKLNTGKIEKTIEDDGKIRYSVVLDNYRLIDQVVIKENIEHGEHIRQFTVYSLPFIGNNIKHDGRIGLFIGQSVGHMRICSFPTIRSKIIDIVLDESDSEAEIEAIEVSYIGDRSGMQLMD